MMVESAAAGSPEEFATSDSPRCKDGSAACIDCLMQGACMACVPAVGAGQALTRAHMDAVLSCLGDAGKHTVVEKVGQAGELLIRAAAVLGTLTPAEKMALDEATDGQLSGCIALSLSSARDLSASVAKSLVDSPPAGFWKAIE